MSRPRPSACSTSSIIRSSRTRSYESLQLSSASLICASEYPGSQIRRPNRADWWGAREDGGTRGRAVAPWVRRNMHALEGTAGRCYGRKRSVEEESSGQADRLRPVIRRRQTLEQRRQTFAQTSLHGGGDISFRRFRIAGCQSALHLGAELPVDAHAVASQSHQIRNALLGVPPGSRHRFDEVLVARRLKAERLGELPVDSREREIAGITVDRLRFGPVGREAPRCPPARPVDFADEDERVGETRGVEGVRGVRLVAVDRYGLRVVHPVDPVFVADHRDPGNVLRRPPQECQQFGDRHLRRAEVAACLARVNRFSSHAPAVRRGRRSGLRPDPARARAIPRYSSDICRAMLLGCCSGSRGARSATNHGGN